MKKNLLILVGLVVLFVGFNGCKPCDENGFFPEVDYETEGLDPNTKGKPISEAAATEAMSEYLEKYFNTFPDTSNIMFKDYFPEYEVFPIHDLIEFIKMSDTTNKKPAYLVVRHGVFKDTLDPTDPSKNRIKTIFYMTDVDYKKVESSDSIPEILYLEELRRCPPDCPPTPDEDPTKPDKDE